MASQRPQATGTIARPAVAARLAPTIDQVWTFVALALPTLAGLMSMRTVDLAYHLRAGDLILGGAIPRVDSFTFTAAGLPWLDQQWGAQLILTIVYRAGGWGGLSLLRAALMPLTFGPVWLACRVRGASVRTASLLTIAGFMVALPSLGMRPQALGLPLFATTVWLVLDRREHPNRLWLVPAMAGLWANVHGSFPLAPGVLGLALIEDLITKAPTRRTTLAVSAVTLVATLVNPFGLGAWWYAFALTANPTIRTYVVEWAPTTVRTASGLLFFASALGVALLIGRRREAASWSSLLWLAAFSLLALPAVRGVVWWAIAAPPIVAGLLQSRANGQGRGDRSVVNLVVVGSLLVALGALFPWRSEPDPRTGAPPQLSDAPQRLVQATASAVPSGARVFVSQVWGSWFELALPQDPVFVDSRIEIFPRAIWIQYDDVMAGREGWQGILDRWRVDAVVLRSFDTEIGRRIADDPGWRLAFSDQQGSVFVRRASGASTRAGG